MSSTIGVQNIAHTNGTNAMTISSGGATTFTTDPFNSVIETWNYDTTGRAHTNDMVLKYGFDRRTSNNTANKNGGMTHSTSAGTEGAGIWTFPSTGIWRIELVLKYSTTVASTGNGVKMKVTTDNNTYSVVDSGYSNGYSTNVNTMIVLPYILNVNDVSNVKFKHSMVGAMTVRGGGDEWSTKIHFIKLCPSV